MKEIKLKRLFGKSQCVMELGKHYRIYSSYGNKVYVKDCTLIRSGKKGFNLLNIEKSQCVFRRNVYQKDSAKKTIPRDQKVFEIFLPDWISKVEAFDDLTPAKFVDIGGNVEEDIETEKTLKTTRMKNALYRMEI